MPKAKRKPSYLLHKATGQARVRIDGRDHYLGEYGSPESRERYDELVSQWLVKNDVTGCTLTLDELALQFTEHAKVYYRKNGQETSEVASIKRALRFVVARYGKTLVRQFGPLSLKTVRQDMIDAGVVRTSINKQIDRIRRMFRWGVENELVPVQVSAALSAVPGLRKGRTDAIESEPVRAVPLAYVDAVEPFVSRQVWAMAELQLLTGARPGEVLSMRGSEINTSGRVWEYTPGSHKTEHHGKRRIIFLGPRAQAVVREFLKPDLEAFLFSPKDAREEFDAKRRAERKTPMTPSQRARQRKSVPKKKPGDRYTVCSYRQAIAKACDKAGVPHWHPNQLRHTAATTIRREADIDTARTVLGHSTLAVTEVYAERDAESARGIMARIG